MTTILCSAISLLIGFLAGIVIALAHGNAKLRAIDEIRGSLERAQ